MSLVDKYRRRIEMIGDDDPTEDINEIRATVLLWYDLHRVGCSLRSIADCFEIDYTVVDDYIKQIPQYVKEANVSEEYLGRLRAAFPEGRRPRTGLDVRSIIEAVSTTHMSRRPPVR